jgi:hypothetical protein
VVKINLEGEYMRYPTQVSVVLEFTIQDSEYQVSLPKLDQEQVDAMNADLEAFAVKHFGCDNAKFEYNGVQTSVREVLVPRVK